MVNERLISGDLSKRILHKMRSLCYFVNHNKTQLSQLVNSKLIQIFLNWNKINNIDEIIKDYLYIILVCVITFLLYYLCIKEKYLKMSPIYKWSHQLS